MKWNRYQLLAGMDSLWSFEKHLQDTYEDHFQSFRAAGKFPISWRTVKYALSIKESAEQSLKSIDLSFWTCTVMEQIFKSKLNSFLVEKDWLNDILNFQISWRKVKYTIFIKEVEEQSLKSINLTFRTLTVMVHIFRSKVIAFLVEKDSLNDTQHGFWLT